MKKDSTLTALIWAIILLSVTYACITNGSKTQLILSANAQEVTFGRYLQDVQSEYADLYLLQKSISICEGGLNRDSLAWRNKNPGNLKAGGETDGQGHTIYPNRLQGYLAHLELLQRKYWGLTPKQMNRNYATSKTWHKCVEWYYKDITKTL